VADRRRKNVNWKVAEEDGSIPSWERVSIAVLMDIRDELQALNARLGCIETLRIPRYLRRIASNTAKPRPGRKSK